MVRNMDEFGTTARTCAQWKAQDPELLALSILVPVMPSDFDMRRAIRETWMADAMLLRSRSSFCESIWQQRPARDPRAVCIDVRFFVGTRQSSGVLNYSLLADEMRRHQDIVILPVAELGSNELVQKSAAMLSWAASYRGYADYVFKVDSDLYLHVPRFVQHLRKPADGDLALFGRMHPYLKMKDSRGADGAERGCMGGELYGISRALLELMVGEAYGSEESGVLGSFLAPDDAGSRWVNGEASWSRMYEDVFVCMRAQPLARSSAAMCPPVPTRAHTRRVRHARSTLAAVVLCSRAPWSTAPSLAIRGDRSRRGSTAFGCRSAPPPGWACGCTRGTSSMRTRTGSAMRSGR